MSELELALGSAIESGAMTHRFDPRPGYWDERADLRTQTKTVRSTYIERDGYGARLRHVATGSCPSGPCGQRTEIATFPLTDLYRYDSTAKRVAPFWGIPVEGPFRSLSDCDGFDVVRVAVGARVAFIDSMGEPIDEHRARIPRIR